MIKRNYRMYLEDILEYMGRIESYTKDITREEFLQNQILLDAVIRNLEVIGEAARNVPKRIRNNYPEISWRSMIGLRNILIHEYFGVDAEIVWEIIKKDLPPIKPILQKILESFAE